MTASHSKTPSIAVLGAGIMGSSTALLLARAGARVVLYDQSPEPFCGASRWNEGKIHLGHLYAADPTLETARRVLPGGLAFAPLVRELLGVSLESAVTLHDDTYLVHRDSVVGADAMAAYLQAATDLARTHPDASRYLVDLTDAGMQALTPLELSSLYDTRLVAAGFRVPERSVNTHWLADRYLEALTAQAGLEQRMHTRVLGVDRPDATSRLSVRTRHGLDGPFDFVVNALWEGRLTVDAGLALSLPDEHNHRYRLSVFIRSDSAYHFPSTVIATGPFGDYKNYAGRHHYLSWYPDGLKAEGNDIEPPEMSVPDAAMRRCTAEAIVSHLSEVAPAIAGLATVAGDMRTEGGWVYASGSGALNNPNATLHRRDRIGIFRDGNYFSVDTGKYSTAPWLAHTVATQICGDRHLAS